MSGARDYGYEVYRADESLDKLQQVQEIDRIDGRILQNGPYFNRGVAKIGFERRDCGRSLFKCAIDLHYEKYGKRREDSKEENNREIRRASGQTFQTNRG